MESQKHDTTTIQQQKQQQQEQRLVEEQLHEEIRQLRWLLTANQIDHAASIPSVRATRIPNGTVTVTATPTPITTITTSIEAPSILRVRVPNSTNVVNEVEENFHCAMTKQKHLNAGPDTSTATTTTSTESPEYLHQQQQPHHPQKQQHQHQQQQQQQHLTNNDTNRRNEYTQQAFSNEIIERYSRQLLIVGVTGQTKIQQTSVLVIGTGGIGSTVLLYLAGAGIQQLDCIDPDEVEISNLHRQIIHSQPGLPKAISAQQRILQLNPTIRCTAICDTLNTKNAIHYIQQYDIIVDATDNVMARYIINDACVMLRKPLISGSAVGTQGQLTIYQNNNNNNKDTDCSNCNACCYRCMYPNPTLQKDCQSCNDAGVLGPVPGCIGILQAMETIKYITSAATTTTTTTTTIPNSSRDTHAIRHDKFIMYDAMSCTFLSIRKPRKNPNCPVCGTNPSIVSMDDTHRNLQEMMSSTCTTTTTIPNSIAPVSRTNDTYDNITCSEYYTAILNRSVPHVLLDVRVPIQYEICSLLNSINIPLDDILQVRMNDKQNNRMEYIRTKLSQNWTLPIYCICRRGIASREAVLQIQRQFEESLVISSSSSLIEGEDTNLNGAALSSSSSLSLRPRVYNILGGLVAWQKEVDASFPLY
jgi:adenylyltransferase and sulfurtransferase